MWAHWNGILHNSPWAKDNILEKQVNDTIVALYVMASIASETNVDWLVQVALQQKTQHDHGQYLSEQQFMAEWVIYW